MAWEKRGGGRYYYQKKRIGGRVVSEYIGTGCTAGLIARHDQAEREKREMERARLQAVIETDQAIERQLSEVESLTRALQTAVMLAHGCHQHKRQWRRTGPEDERE